MSRLVILLTSLFYLLIIFIWPTYNASSCSSGEFLSNSTCRQCHKGKLYFPENIKICRIFMRRWNRLATNLSGRKLLPSRFRNLHIVHRHIILPLSRTRIPTRMSIRYESIIRHKLHSMPFRLSLFRSIFTNSMQHITTVDRVCRWLR